MTSSALLDATTGSPHFGIRVPLDLLNKVFEGRKMIETLKDSTTSTTTVGLVESGTKGQRT